MKDLCDEDHYIKTEAFEDAGYTETANLLRGMPHEGPMILYRPSEIIAFCKEYMLAECDMIEGPIEVWLLFKNSHNQFLVATSENK